ncbi:MAG: bifunctional diguanylate cyclase/phosphodiesterase [Pseudomonadota bacterium]
MLRRQIMFLTGLPKRLGFSPYRIELLVFFPPLAVLAASIWDRSIAEITGIVLPALLVFDILFRGVPALHDQPSVISTDATTGLPTRATMDAAIARIADTNSKMATACLFIRIDDHDSLARKWGADARDEILRRTAERLRSTVRSQDTLVRVEDGTFGLVLSPKPANRPDDVAALARRISKALNETIHVGGGAALVTVSVGIACIGDLTLPELTQAAESAVTEAQRKRPGTIQIFTRELRERMGRDVELARNVDRALSNGEIRPWFQPQICTDSGEITGFEALARWHHPTKGTLAPALFLDAVENAGCMPRLSEAMLQDALSALAAWDRKGLKIPAVSVNFSSVELRDPDLADRVKWEVDRYDVDPSRLTVEILESVAASGHDDIILRNVDQFASHGFNLDLDDFGTGQASIQNIRRFRIQRIKIDRSFVTDINTDPEQQSVVAGILSLAQQLEVDTLAEGVETTGEHSILAQLGCGHVQGFGISRPMPFEDTFAWIETHRSRASLPPLLGRKTG